MSLLRSKRDESGFALVSVMVLLGLLVSMMLTHFGLTRIEMSTTKSSMNSFVGFYAAEAGLNIRADLVRADFQGYDRPTGTSPDPTSTTPTCEGANDGSGDLGCLSYKFQDRKVATFLVEAADSGNPIVIPRGETYQNLNGREYHYVVYSQARNSVGTPEAVLEMHVKSRLVPLFQFAAFYDKDLEIFTGDALLEGPIHANGDLYVGSTGTLDITGQVTTAGDLYRGRKDADACLAGPVRVNDPENLVELPTCSATRRLIAPADVTAWDDMVDSTVTALTVPELTSLDPTPGSPYWDSADLRVVLDLNGATPAVEVRNADGTTDLPATAVLAACGVAKHSDTLYNRRETEWVEMLNVDVQGLLDCAQTTGLMGVGLDDATDGGLVWYFGVDGPSADVVNDYGVRVMNGAELISTVAGAPLVQGLSISTAQAMYVEGDFNALNKKPAAFLADSLNVLSNSWSDADSDKDIATRAASDTTINAGFLAGTDTTGGAEGTAGQDSGGFAGGLGAFMRLHEDWTGDTLAYRGSFVSLGNPQHVDGAWVYGGQHYFIPVIDWGYDTDFEDALLLPPLSPQFVYVKQDLFVRQFEL